MMMASTDASSNHRDITTAAAAVATIERGENRFSSCQDTIIQQTNYRQYLDSSLCDKHESTDHRFLQQQVDQQQQQQRLYESHQEHKSFIQNPCNCYQNGGNQVCSRCQTNEEQHNVGAFIYQTIQADNVVSRPNESSQQQQLQQNQTNNSGAILIRDNLQSTSYSHKLQDDSYSQEPVFENNISPYYLKQQEEYNNRINNNNNNNNDLISVRCQTACSSYNNNDNSSNIVMNGNEVASADGLFYRCSNNNELIQYCQDTATTDDWKQQQRSLGGRLGTNNSGEDKLFGCNIDSNNNNSSSSHPAQQEAHQPFQEQYSILQIAQDVSNNNNSNNFTSVQSHYYQQAANQCANPFESPFESTNQQQQQQQHQITQLGVYDTSPQTGDRHHGHFVNGLDSSADQSCFPSSSDGSSPSCQLSAIEHHQSSSLGNKNRARRKNPASLSKVNGKLWEFIRDLLLSDRTNPAFIRWERREDGVFKFVQSNKVAKMWGERKQNPKMTYEKLSRAMRYYYKSKVLLPVFGRRLVYKFGPNASGWNKTG